MRNISVQQRSYGPVHVYQGRFRFWGRSFSFCCYCVDGLLIDTGPSCARAVLTRHLQHEKVERIVLTHYHEDHSGNARHFADFFHVPILAAERTEQLANSLSIPLYRRWVWGKRIESFPADPLPDRLETPNHRFIVLETPGHSEDHRCLLDEERGWLFAGDLYLGPKLYYAMPEESIPVLMTSIRKVLSHSFDILFCGHQGVVENAHDMLSIKLQYLESLSERVWKLHNKGYSAREITRQCFPGGRLEEWFTGGEWSSINLVRSIINGKS